MSYFTTERKRTVTLRSTRSDVRRKYCLQSVKRKYFVPGLVLFENIERQQRRSLELKQGKDDVGKTNVKGSDAETHEVTITNKVRIEFTVEEGL